MQATFSWRLAELVGCLRGRIGSTISVMKQKIVLIFAGLAYLGLNAPTSLRAESGETGQKLDRLEKVLQEVRANQNAIMQRLGAMEASIRQAATGAASPRLGSLRNAATPYPAGKTPGVGELVAVKYGGSWWAGRIVEARPDNRFQITYLGWEPFWDEEVGLDRLGESAEVVQMEEQMKKGVPLVRRRVPVPPAPGTAQPPAGPGPEVGQEAPGFEIKTTDDKTIKLADYRGKYVLLDFWATWCGPCVAETPNLKAVYDAYGTRDNFVIIGLSLDNEKEKPIAYAQEKGTRWIDGFLGDWGKDEVTKKYGVGGIPSIWLIGPDGRVVAKGLRGEAILQAVREAIEGKKS